MVRAHSGILSYDSQRLSPRFVMKYTLQSAQLNHFAILLKLLITQYCKPQPTPVLLPGKFHGWRSLVGYSPWSHKESDKTEQLHFLSFYSSFWRRNWQPTPVFLPGESHGQEGPRGLQSMELQRVGHH